MCDDELSHSALTPSLTRPVHISIVFSFIADTRSAKKKDNNDEELDDIEYLPPKEEEKKKKKMSKEATTDNTKMSEEAAKAAAQAHLLFSSADADIDEDNWTAEDVFLSKAYEKKLDTGTSKYRWNAYMIVILTHCQSDSEKCGALPLTANREAAVHTVRVSKPRIPGILKDGKGTIVIQNLMNGNKKAADSFGESVCNDNGNENVLVDVHFPRPIRKIVTKVIIDKKLNFFAVAFEVEEVEVRQTAKKRAKQKSARCEVSE